MKPKLKIDLIIICILVLSIFGCNLIGATNPTNIETPKVSGSGIENNTKAPASATASPSEIGVNFSNPCIGAPAPEQWNHVVVLMFENSDSFIGSPDMPFITELAHNCGTSYDWYDADYRVDGSDDGEYEYDSKPNYATLTNGLSPSDHGLLDDTYETQTKAESIFDQLKLAGKSFKVYYDAEPGGCSVDFNGDYHDPIRYYTSMAAICDEHDVPLPTFMKDVNNGNLPAFSIIIPSNDHNMHDNSLQSGDTWARDFLEPFLNSATYKEGDVALFFLWDEDSPVPNVLISPSISPGLEVPVPSGNPISHFSALRTWEEMLGLPLLGDTNLAPSLLPFFNGS